MQKIKDNFLAQLVVIYTRYLLGGAFVFASLVKIEGSRFTAQNGENDPIGTAFHFFETMYRTGIYWQFIGWGQLLAGMLLMTQRFSKLGSVVYFPIILNIFVITISMEFNYTPVITGLMLMANVMLLIWHWNELRTLIDLPLIPDKPNRLEDQITWRITGLILFLVTICIKLFIYVQGPIFWFGTCVLVGLGGLIIGWRRWVSKA